MTDKEKIKILADALDFCWHRFHGLSAAVSIHNERSIPIDMELLANKLQEGNKKACQALIQTGEDGYSNGGNGRIY